MERISITVDGCDYSYEYDAQRGELSVFTADGEECASGYYDNTFEQFAYKYYDENGFVRAGGSSSDLYHNYRQEEIASWLVSTHPEWQ